jgi:DNA-binding GntR family transcriptional regulator
MTNPRATYQQQAYEYVKSQITNRGFKPGEYVTDAQIAKQLNISRTPVREAFHRLENESLLVYEARHGWKVHTLTLKDINEIFDIKEVVEGMAARKAAGCQDEKLRIALQNAFQTMCAASEAGDVDTWIQADLGFHDVIFAMADNERARRLIYNLNDQWNRVYIGFTTIRSRVSRSINEHRAVMEGILAGNGEEAERQTCAHFQHVREELIHLLVNMVLPFVDEGV